MIKHFYIYKQLTFEELQPSAHNWTVGHQRRRLGTPIGRSTARTRYGRRMRNPIERSGTTVIAVTAAADHIQQYIVRRTALVRQVQLVVASSATRPSASATAAVGAM